MSLETFSYTPGEVNDKTRPSWIAGPDPGLQADKQLKESRWEPPAGHASWCWVQLPPRWRHKPLGDTPMAAKGACNCPKNSVTRSLKKLSGEAPAPKIRTRKAKTVTTGHADCLNCERLLRELERIADDLAAVRSA